MCFVFRTVRYPRLIFFWICRNKRNKDFLFSLYVFAATQDIAILWQQILLPTSRIFLSFSCLHENVTCCSFCNSSRQIKLTPIFISCNFCIQQYLHDIRWKPIGYILFLCTWFSKTVWFISKFYNLIYIDNENMHFHHCLSTYGCNHVLRTRYLVRTGVT